PAPAAPAQPAPDPAAKPAATAKGDTEVVCKTIAVTGTRFGTRQCKSKAEWAAITEAAREYTQKATNPACTGGCSVH
ncbi:hypothetical protein ACNJUT_21635, partial [Mycobacterium tuberculosis]